MRSSDVQTRINRIENVSILIKHIFFFCIFPERVHGFIFSLLSNFKQKKTHMFKKLSFDKTITHTYLLYIYIFIYMTFNHYVRYVICFFLDPPTPTPEYNKESIHERFHKQSFEHVNLGHASISLKKSVVESSLPLLLKVTCKK